MKKYLLFFLLSALAFICLNAQGNAMHDTLKDSSTEITILRNTDFQTALKIIESLSLSEERRNIVNTSKFTGTIPFPINNMPWKEALNMIVKTLNLVLEIKPGAYFISDPTAAEVVVKDAIEKYNIHDKMVRINATFLNVDKTFMNNLGINWNTIFDGTVRGSIGLTTTTDPTPPLNPNLRVGPKLGPWDWGTNSEGDPGTISLDVLFNYIEANNKGSVLARPTITVLNGKEGRIQVGEDFSVSVKDENGAITEKFYSTGIMLTVLPTILEEDGFEVIYLQSNVEKSSVSGTTTASGGTVISRNSARGDVMLFDGEETVIGGLIDTTTEKVTGGVPFLNRVPILKWIFGYSSNRTATREMIVILKTELVSPAKERIQEKNNYKDEYKQMQENYDEKKKEIFSGK